MTEPVSTRLPSDIAYGVDARSTAALYKVSWGAIFAGKLLRQLPRPSLPAPF